MILLPTIATAEDAVSTLQLQKKVLEERAARLQAEFRLAQLEYEQVTRALEAAEKKVKDTKP